MRRVPVPPPLVWPNFGAFLAEISERYADRAALRYRARGERAFEVWSYGRLAAEAEALAAFLRDRGLVRGDRVALWSENRPEWAAAYLGVVAAGMVAVPIDALADADEVDAILATAEAEALVVSAKLAEGADLFVRGAPSLRAAVLLEAPHTASGIPGGAKAGASKAEGRSAARIALGSWEEAIAAGKASGGPALPPPSSIAPDSIASLIFTSGTTGKPKGVMLSHRGIIANIDAARQALPIDENDVFMCVLPLHHTYPTTCSLLSPLSIGASATICEKVVGKVIVDDVRDSGGV